MAVGGSQSARRMGTAVHVDGPEGMRPADVEDVDPLLLRQLDELDAVRRLELARHAGRLTAGVRLELVDLAIGKHSSRPGLHGQLFDRLDRDTGDSGTRQPHALVPRGGALQENASSKIS